MKYQQEKSNKGMDDCNRVTLRPIGINSAVSLTDNRSVKQLMVKSQGAKSLSGNGTIQLKWNEEAETGLLMWDRAIDGVVWFCQPNGLMYYNIVNPADILLGNRENYERHKGEKKTWEEWNRLSVVPVQYPTEAEFAEAHQGWHAPGSGINWEDATQEELNRFQSEAMEFGIRPLINLLLAHASPEQRLLLNSRMDNATGRLLLMPTKEFALRSLYFSNTEDPNSARLSIAEIMGKLRRLMNSFKPPSEESVLKDAIEMCGGIQGQAMGPYQVINAGSAFKEQGLHLIIHETMHNLASPEFAKALRNTELGDEGLNEYFARLASLALRNSIHGPRMRRILGSPKGNIDASNSANTKAREGRGVYGDFIQNWTEHETLALAKVYFLNDATEVEGRILDYIRARTMK